MNKLFSSILNFFSRLFSSLMARFKSEEPDTSSGSNPSTSIKELWSNWGGPESTDPIFVPSPTERLKGSEGHPSAGLVNAITLADNVVFIPTGSNESFDPSDSSVNQLFKAHDDGTISFLGAVRAPAISLEDGTEYGIIHRDTPRSFSNISKNKLVSIGQLESEDHYVSVGLYEIEPSNLSMVQLDEHKFNVVNGPRLTRTSSRSYTIEAFPDGSFVVFAISDTNFVQGNKNITSGNAKVATSSEDAIKIGIWKDNGLDTTVIIDFSNGLTANHFINSINDNVELKQEGITANLVASSSGVKLKIKRRKELSGVLSANKNQPRITIDPLNDGGKMVLEKFFDIPWSIRFDGGGQRTIVGQLFSINDSDKLVPGEVFEYPLLSKLYDQDDSVTDSRADIRFIDVKSISDDVMFVGATIRNPSGDTELVAFPLINESNSLIFGKPAIIVESEWGSDDPFVLSGTNTPLTVTGATVAREADDEGIIFSAVFQGTGSDSLFSSDFIIPDDLPHYRYSGLEHLGDDIFMYLVEREFIIEEGDSILDFHGWSLNGALIIETVTDLPDIETARHNFVYVKENGKTYQKKDETWEIITEYPKNDRQFETVAYIYSVDFDIDPPKMTILNVQLVRSDDFDLRSHLAVSGSATITTILNDGRVFATFRSSEEKGFNNGAQILHP